MDIALRCVVRHFPLAPYPGVLHRLMNYGRLCHDLRSALPIVTSMLSYRNACALHGADQCLQVLDSVIIAIATLPIGDAVSREQGSHVVQEEAEVCVCAPRQNRARVHSPQSMPKRGAVECML